VLGTPDKQDWPEGYRLAAAMSFRFPRFPERIMTEVVPAASLEAVQLIVELLRWNPAKRPSAQQSLRFTYFRPNVGVGRARLLALRLAQEQEQQHEQEQRKQSKVKWGQEFSDDHVRVSRSWISEAAFNA
jgi:hypothetical protein